MVNTGKTITQKDVYNVLRSNWKSIFKQPAFRKKELAELGFSTMEVNLMLNSIEWKYQVQIDEDNVPLQITMEEFVDRILSSSRQIA